jgi:hypothetical protein
MSKKFLSEMLRQFNRYRSLSPLLPHCSACWVPPPPPDHPKIFHSTPLHLLPPSSILSSHTRDISTSQTRLTKKEGVMARFKQMVKDYWYVIIPVEIGTSVIWYGAIFISLKSGVDLVEILATMGVSENTLGKLPSAGGDYGYHALTFLCYKVISPIRHTISLAISAALVSRLEKTRPGYLRTSSNIAKDARGTGEDMRDRYEEKVAEGKEKMDEFKNKADVKRSAAKKNLEERMEGWRKK